MIPLSDVRPGMVLSDVLLDRAGQMLLPQGTALTAATLASLGRHGIGMLAVRVDDIPGPDPAQVQARLDHLFRGHVRNDDNDWAASVLRRHVEDYRLARGVAP
jgi:hypothetical protein